MLRIVVYQASWPELFEREAQALRAEFGASALRIEHVGSTAVPGLAAKPVIDIQVSVAALAPLAPHTAALERLGYAQVALGDFDKVYPFFARPARWPSTHHVHLCEAGGEQEARHLAFRDHLRGHPALGEQYVQLKRRLAAAHHGDTLASRERYSLGKTEFVESVLARARLNPARSQVRIGGMSKAELRVQLVGQGVQLNAAALELFDSALFQTAAAPTLIEVVDVSVAELGCAGGATMPVLLERARQRGWAPCPLEAGPHLRLQYLDQPEGLVDSGSTRGRAPPGSLTVVSLPVSASWDVPMGFYLRRVAGALWLRGYRSDDAHVWAPSDRLLFRVLQPLPGA